MFEIIIFLKHSGNLFNLEILKSQTEWKMKFFQTVFQLDKAESLSIRESKSIANLFFFVWFEYF